MKTEEVLRKLEGMHTIKTATEALNLDRQKTIHLIHRLRKKGLVQTTGGGKQKRIYRFGIMQKQSEPNMFDIINKYSKVKINEPFKYIVHGKKLSVEEVIIEAIKTKQFRTMLACLGLFNHIKSWPRLYHYAKENGIKRIVGAFYDTARKMIKIKRMDERTRKNLMKDADTKIIDILGIGGSKDFKDIEQIWKVKIPFNKSDLMRHKEAA